MNTFGDSAGGPRTPAGPRDRAAGAEAASSQDLSSLLNYPALGRLFEGPDTRALDEMRARLERTAQDLERVVRQGSREDAERAGRASRAVAVTLSFLDELAQGRAGGK